MWPTIQALKMLGGSATISEINQRVIADEDFSEEQQAIKRRPDDHMSMIEYRLAWARNGLKLVGALENSKRGVWAVTESGKAFPDADVMLAAVRQWRSEYNRQYQERKKEEAALTQNDSEDPEDGLSNEMDTAWTDQVLDRLMQLSPAAFERLAQRLLREADFRDVEVLGRSGDGGIDGVGDLKISLVSFPVYFQCKRYRDPVGSSAVRDFRGAMSGRGDKGLLITTSTFTREARLEASRDGAPPIELVSGQDLAELLLRYEVGVRATKRVIEEVVIDRAFFDQFED